jgi:hypothetical protein
MGYNNNQKKGELIFHSTLVKAGPTIVRVKGPPKLVKNGQMCLVDVEREGADAAIVIESPHIEAGFKSYVGQTVVLIAKGDARKNTAEMVFQPAPGTAADPAPQQQAHSYPASQPAARQGKTMRDAKVYFHQAANLMRIAVKKAEDIASELGLPQEHRQGIATTLFIQSERQGFIAAMPVDPITPEQLGWVGAGREFEPPQPAYVPAAAPEPESQIDEGEDNIPF